MSLWARGSLHVPCRIRVGRRGGADRAAAAAAVTAAQQRRLRLRCGRPALGMAAGGVLWRRLAAWALGRGSAVPGPGGSGRRCRLLHRGAGLTAGCPGCESAV